REEPGPSAPIVARYPEGTTVEVLDGPVEAPEDGSLWYQVAVDALSGYMAAIYLAPADADPSPTDDGADAPPVVTGSAVIVNTNGDGIRCRAAPTTDAAILYRFVEGDPVDLLGDPIDGWQPVRCAGQIGYVAAEFIGTGDEPTGTSDVDEVDTADTGTAGMGQVQGTNGDGVRCRAKASLDGTILVVLAEGTQVPLRGAAKGDWQPVTCAGKNGFVSTLYIGPVDEGGDPGDDDTGGDANTDLQTGETAVVSGTNGDGVRLRSGAGFDASVVTVVREGQQVQIRAGSTGDWVAVTYRGSDGFIHTDYLVRAGADGAGDSGGGDFGTGDHAMTTDNLRLRGAASLDGEVLAVAAAGTVVVVTGAESNGFYPVDWDGLEGWMHADYLAWTDAPVTSRETGIGGDAGSAPGSADGQAIVDYAMHYLGYPYVWATHGPATFDCSGFTYWVVLHVLGEDIGTGTWTQSVAGRPVAYGDLQPGDLVFFQNTFEWGLSHVGIYIGTNQFIHAENEDTGVRISNLTSPYYASRWYGARRLVSSD
ncbi:MAG TPA: C40 family peptidase, partial [Thermomicrobiales bacterium]